MKRSNATHQKSRRTAPRTRRPAIQIKRVYEEPADSDGRRFLAERLWPRGVSREALRLDGWARDAAPSTELRKWFNHDPARWAEFRRRYRAELAAQPAGWEPLLRAAMEGPITLLFSTHDPEHNNVVVLREFLEARLARSRAGKRVGAPNARRTAAPK